MKSPKCNVPSQINPEGIRKQLAWLKKTYGDIEILITENGYSNTGGLDDFDRIDFQQKYLKQVKPI